ncbi:MAG TPA: 50S ribosomal protein L18 [Patescibacteria group bacterium]|jgi:large subunit ribosomal protein L18|nr:50S ribosomal protein L18 [Patescibacteria group bacterium]
MNRLTHKIKNAELRRNRVRAKVSGTAKRPRLSVHISNRHIIGQLINDETASTLVYVSTVGKKEVPAKMTEKAAWVGAEVAKAAKAAKISSVVFDRGSHLYHGRIKILADNARTNGLEF